MKGLKVFFATILMIGLFVSIVSAQSIPTSYCGAHKNHTILIENKQGDLREHSMQAGMQFYYILPNSMLSVITTSEWNDPKAKVIKVVNKTRKIGNENIKGIDIYTQGRKNPIFIGHVGQDDDGDEVFVSRFVENGKIYYVRTWVSN